MVDCIELPPNTHEGRQGVQAALQLGKFPAAPQRISKKSSLHFEADIEVDGEPNVRDFRGKAVQGGRGNRFLYICWGWYENQQWEGFRRAKIPFRTLPGAILEAAVATGVLRVAVKCTGEDGGPVCANVKSFRLEWSAGEPLPVHAAELVEDAAAEAEAAPEATPEAPEQLADS
jgi:hypothetical protein